MTNKQALIEKISARTARIGVIGLGYVGLPLAVEFAAAGFRTTGFEVDDAKVRRINQGESYIPDVTSEQVAESVTADRLDATTDFARLRDADVIIICVPTPLRKTKEPDVSFILAAAENICVTLRPGQLIILESTTYPGTTDEVLRPMFDEIGLKIDQDYFLAFSPERIDPGNDRFNTRNIPKVVGGVTEASTDVAAATYGAVVETVHRVSSARVAETCKLLENTFRAVNIGLVNEMAQLCYTLGIDSWEVIGAAATKPFGFMPFYPGPGIGGHCLVGDETIVVRSTGDSMERIQTLASVFSEHCDFPKVGDLETRHGEMVVRPNLEALSLNTETQLSQWKPVSYLFRRQFTGNLVTVTTSDNRRLTVTDLHPMLVSEPEGQVRTVFAKDLVEGDRIPIHALAALSCTGQEHSYSTGSVSDLNFGVHPLIEDQVAYASRTARLARAKAKGILTHSGLLITVPVKSVEIKPTTEPVTVYSAEIEDTHTFMTSYGIFVHNCIPLDPHYLSWKARMHGFEARFISLAEEVNSRMPEHVVELIADGLNRQKKAVNGSRILILGVAYKRDIDDVRESPALAIIEQLRKMGGEVSYHDPHISEIRLEGENDERLQSIELTESAVGESDCLVIVTDHSLVDYRWVVERAPLIIDTRNATRDLKRQGSAGKIIRL